MLAQYLLGELPEEEQGRLEERIFIGENFDQLMAVEEDLVEDYLHGQLNASERERFEKFYLTSPRRRERVIFTKALLEVLQRAQSEKNVAPQTEPSPWWSNIFAPLREPSLLWRFSLATACLIIFAGLTWLVIETMQLRSQSQQLRTELTEAKQRQQEQIAQEHANTKRLMEELQIVRSENMNSQAGSHEAMRSPSSIPVLLLTASNFYRSGGESKTFLIPRDAHQLQLQLEFPASAPYRRFVASVQAPEGELIALRRANLLAPGKVTVVLNTSLFRTNDYILTLKASNAANELEDIADYQFTIIKK